jgi:hypothetical protein
LHFSFAPSTTTDIDTIGFLFLLDFYFFFWGNDTTNHKEYNHLPTAFIMGKLIKNHWARLIILTAAAYQVAAAIEGFLFPKVFWDFLTKTLDGAVRPIPVLQIINLLLGIGMFALEWPLGFLAGSTVHRSLEIRLAILPLCALSAILLYQATNPAIYYMIGMVIYFVAYSEGEMICAKPWTLPQRGRSGGSNA